jgi:hypothetical protein
MKTGQTGGKINYYLSLPATPAIVIMGNSRSLYQIIPDSFKVSCFNLSHAGMGQIFQTGLLSVLNDHHKIPSVILLHLEPEEFTGKQTDEDIQNLKYYYGRNELVTNYIVNLSKYEKWKFYFQSYRFNGRVITLFKNYLQTIRGNGENNGYSMIERSERDSINVLRAVDHPIGSPEENFNFDQWRYLEAFLNSCKQANTLVICFTSPIYKGFGSYSKTTQILKSSLSRLNTPYINFLKHPIAKLEEHPGFWKDTKHLNHDGAQLESEALANAVMEILTSKGYR